MNLKTSTIKPGLVMTAINLRDFGGFRTKGGSLMKTGLLYRSGNLQKLSASNHVAISELYLQTIIDFRSLEEQEKSPGTFPGSRKVSLPCNIDQITRDRLRPLLLRRYADNEIVEAIDSVYKEMVDLMVAPIGEMIRIILNTSNCPILIHCRAGKDRTGFAAAVIQWAMDVDHETVMNEYLKSNEFISPKISKALKRLRLFTLGLFPKGNLQAAFEVRAQYLNTAFFVIETKYGGLERYLAAGGVHREDLDDLKALLLER
ncbi:MAG: tyrosine-protein phosphatase [Bacteroidales bacterium]